MGPGLSRPTAQTIDWHHVHVGSDNTYLMHKAATLY